MQNTKEIMIIEKDRLFSNTLTKSLDEICKSKGSLIRVKSLNDGSYAATFANAKKYNLITIDFDLPGMNGAQVYNSLDKDSRKKVIFISSACTSTIKMALIDLGINDNIFHLPKKDFQNYTTYLERYLI